MPRYPVTMVVKEVHGDQFPPPCPVHKVGDKIALNNASLEGKVCFPVFTQVMFRLYGLAGGMQMPNTMTYKCPDKAKVVFEIRRDPDHWFKDAVSPLTDADVKAPSI